MTAMVNLSWLPPIFAQASERLVSNLSEFAGTATVWLTLIGVAGAQLVFAGVSVREAMRQ